MTDLLGMAATRGWLKTQKVWTLSRGGVLLVILSVAATALLRWGLDHFLNESAPLLAFVLPVAICAALGGFAVGIVATICGAIVGNYFFFDPIHELELSSSGDVARVVIFVVVGLVISTMSGRMHREIARAIEAERQVAMREARLRESDTRLRLALDAANAGTWDWNINQDKLHWSETNYALYGRDPKSRPVTQYRHWLELLPDADRSSADTNVQRLFDALQHDDNYRYEFRINHPKKGERWVLGLGRLMRDEYGQPSRLIGINLDITDRKRVEEAERAARADAERANRMKDEFVATISHELRTPLTAILGWAQILKRPVRDPDKLDRGLEVIERNARQLAQLVSDLLDVGRIVTGKLRLETSPVDLAAVTRGVLETIRPIAVAKGIKLCSEFEPLEEPMLGDASRIEQIVWNLLSNAIKFTPRDGTVEVHVEARVGYVAIVVSDTGQGIAPEFLPHLFERFRQQDSSLSRMHGGLGLGLALVKHLAELHGGRVRAQSDGPNRGATFTVELPLTSLSARHSFEEPPCQAPAPSPEVLGGVRVLVVEDEPDTREFVQRVLEGSAAQVVSAGSAAEALEMLDKACPDVLVSDIGMPGMDGYALVRTIHARAVANRARLLPALALTALARNEDRQRALDAGYAEHVTKPIDPCRLVMAVARLCRNSRPAGGAESTVS